MCQLIILTRLVLLLGLVVSLEFACSPAVAVPPEPPGPGRRVGHFILYERALDWVRKMNRRRYGGYSDWRMPSRAEYETLYDPKHPQRSYMGRPVGYSTVFAADGGEWYWTSDVAEWGDPPNHIHDAWTFSFITG